MMKNNSFNDKLNIVGRTKFLQISKLWITQEHTFFFSIFFKCHNCAFRRNPFEQRYKPVAREQPTEFNFNQGTHRDLNAIVAIGIRKSGY